MSRRNNSLQVSNFTLHLSFELENHFGSLITRVCAFSFLQFDDILNTIFSSPPTVAMIVGTLLDNTLEARYNIDDRGIPWWKPFQHRKGDVRTEEFYGFPLRINEYLPTRFM